jgi:hypothetical protein
LEVTPLHRGSDTPVADIIAVEHPDCPADELRAIAFGYLARPAELLALLLEHTHDDPDPDPDPDGADPDPDPDGAGDPGDSADPGEPVLGGGRGSGGGRLNRAIAFPADLLAALRAVDLAPLAPRCVLYVHLHQAALHGTDAVARVEGLGPLDLTGLQNLTGHTRLTVRPVLDLSDRIRTTAYEHPESLKERIHLTTGGDYWPYATSTSRGVDYDHPTPYTHPDPHTPGQTGTHNSGPLGRRHHRWKTHAGYHARQAGHGRYVWITPHGLAFLVDHTGTHPLDPRHARLIADAPPDIDLYPTPWTLDTDPPPP